MEDIRNIPWSISPEEMAVARECMGKALKDVEIDNDVAFKGIEAIIMSMTPEERDNPEIINGSRRKRIADGSGTTVVDVNKLLKQFEATRKIMKTALTGNLAQRMRGFRR